MSSINSFADTLFRLLFGWARTLLQRVWRAAFSGGLGGFFTWLGDHWLVLALLLCLAGTAVDFIVWMVRWRPYLVWRTKLRRFLRFLRGERAESTDPRRFARGYRKAVALEMPPAAGSAPRQAEEHWTEAEWLPAGPWQQQDALEETLAPDVPPAPVIRAEPSYADPIQQTRTNVPLHPSAAMAEAAYAPVQAPPPAAPGPSPMGYPQPAQDLPGHAQPIPPQPAPIDYAPEGNGRARRFTPAADYELPPIEPSTRPNSAYTTDLPAARRRRRSDKYDRKRATWRERLVSVTEEEEGMLDGLPPAVDRQQAFHEPVYPQQYRQQPPPGWGTNQMNGNQSV